MVRLFERPLLSPQWVYPCTLEDVRQQLSLLPPEDLEGLHAVGLCCSTRKDCSANGRYFYGEKPTIHLYSHSHDLRYKQSPGAKLNKVEEYSQIELEYGMRVRQEGGRIFCEWDAENLRRFILEFVLLHEVGHHVYHWGRRQQGLVHSPRTVESEQQADAYALRMRRLIRRGRG